MTTPASAGIVRRRWWRPPQGSGQCDGPAAAGGGGAALLPLLSLAASARAADPAAPTPARPTTVADAFGYRAPTPLPSCLASETCPGVMGIGQSGCAPVMSSGANLGLLLGSSDGQGSPAIDVPPAGPSLPLMMVPVAPPSVYAPPEAERPEDLTNKGGVNVDLNFRYLTDYNYRGISFNRANYTSANGSKEDEAQLHASNFQADATLTFDLGKLPHPFVAVLANINDHDLLSRFQEVRPSAGFDYNLRPILVRTGINAYIYPERERQTPSPNTAEVFTRLTLDDSYFFLTDSPILQPYVEANYDYQVNHGWYIEAGLQHRFAWRDAGASITPYADVAYVSHYDRTFVAVSPQDSGFQHYDVGLTGDLSLNHLFSLPNRYGSFDLQGYLTYTGKFSNPIRADTEVWGGVGLKYRY